MNDLYDILNGLGITDAAVTIVGTKQITQCNYFVIPVWLVVFVYEPEFRNDFYIVSNIVQEDELCVMTQYQTRCKSLRYYNNFRNTGVLVDLVQEQRANITKMLLC